MTEPICTCSRLRIGTDVSNARAWRPDCPQHGISSSWYQLPEQVMARSERSIKLRQLQAEARAARLRVTRNISPQSIIKTQQDTIES
jgi:hypothetical protein